jgi:hypothetical protein
LFEYPGEYAAGLILDLTARVTPAGTVNARGTAEIDHGRSSTLLVAESRGSSASCAGTDTGGQAITELTISFRHEHSGERVLATVTPERPIEASGRYLVSMTFDRFGAYEFWMDATFGERPGRSLVRSPGG